MKIKFKFFYLRSLIAWHYYMIESNNYESKLKKPY